MITGDAARSRWLTLGFGLIVSAISVWLVVRDVDLNRLRQALSAALEALLISENMDSPKKQLPKEMP